MTNCCKHIDLHKQLEELEAYVFLCFASFEERCLSVPRTLKGKKIAKTIIFQFEEFKHASNGNLAELAIQLPNYEHVELKNNLPMMSVDILVGIISEIKRLKFKNILVDVSCFNREVLLILLHLLYSEKDNFFSIKFIYNSAGEMPFDLSFGLLDVRSVFGFGGLASPLKKDHIIVLLGFEYERARQIIEEYEPALVTIAIGGKNESISLELHEKNRKALDNFNKLKNQIICPIDEIEIPINSPRDTMMALQSIIAKNNQYNTILAPLNTKLSTIGAGMAAILGSDIQICYSQMADYNFVNYSKPGDDFYICDISALFSSVTP